MRTRAILITVLMATGVAASLSRPFCATATGRSAHAFGQYFQALRQERLNPVERVVFSLVLAHQ
jgi:transposase